MSTPPTVAQRVSTITKLEKRITDYLSYELADIVDERSQLALNMGMTGNTKVKNFFDRLSFWYKKRKAQGL